MAENDAGTEKTERATPKRRDDVRKEGQVCTSKEFSQAVILLAGIFFLNLYMPFLMSDMRNLLVEVLSNASDVEISFDTMPVCSVWFIFRFFRLIFLPVIFFAVVAYFVTFAQVGPLIKEFKIDLKKLNPLKGMKSLFSSRTAVRMVVDIVKLIVISFVFYRAVTLFLPEMFNLADMELDQIMAFTGHLIFWLLVRIFFLMLIVSFFDYAFQKWRYEEDIKMTKQEVKDEMKNREGDPQIKARIRAIQMQLARQRMFAKIPQADVVITNPVHYAIAVQYDIEAMSAPKVVAKGARKIAQKIKDIAMEHNIPIVENKPLAQALYKSVEVDQEVPAKLYQSVAEVLAYVYQLNRRKMEEVNRKFEPAMH